MKKFEPAFINARTLDEAYFMLISKCWDHGVKYLINDGSFAGSHRLELAMASGIIHFPHTLPLAPIMPEGIPPTTTDEKIHEYFANYLMNPELEDNEEYKYSTWINGKMFHPVHEKHESQLEWCIRHFKEKGFGNNHCFITVGTPEINFNYDFPYSNESERRTSPCLRGLDIKIKDNKVILGVIYRSWDLFAGFPENMGGFTLLNEYIASLLSTYDFEVEPGPLTFFSQGLHCYDHQIETVMQYLRKE
jgi:thymidylate synthase